jgi:hypothetical protein
MDNTKAYYYALMLALLKPWRNIGYLKDKDQTWESAFNGFMEMATQQDRDVVAGSQYYYETRTVAANKKNKEEENCINEDDDHNIENEDRFENQFHQTCVCFFLCLFFSFFNPN